MYIVMHAYCYKDNKFWKYYASILLVFFKRCQDLIFSNL